MRAGSRCSKVSSGESRSIARQSSARGSRVELAATSGNRFAGTAARKLSSRLPAPRLDIRTDDDERVRILDVAPQPLPQLRVGLLVDQVLRENPYRLREAAGAASGR
jgi:hypothetical protein